MLELKQVIQREKIEQDLWESELDNQVGEVVVDVSQTIKEKSRIKEEKNETEEE